jgi:hypothetical protein
MTTEEIILSFGFHPSGTCDCGGMRNEKYRKGEIVIYVRKKSGHFKIKRKNQVVVPLTNLNVLEETLQKTFPQQVAG